MMLPQKPDEKLAAVREAYLSHIIPNIQRIYEKTNLAQESFILTHCAILSLSGFYAGAKDTDGSTYRKFITDFFPSEYNPDGLWKGLRTGLVHAYTWTSLYILAYKHPEKHFCQQKSVKSESTGECSDLTYLNFENFFDDFREAAQSYFEKVKTEPNLTRRLCARYDIAPPIAHIADEDIC